jgi:acetylornithine deacetylase/succinyl-diaminopimelate desuccinylase-like protein
VLIALPAAAIPQDHRLVQIAQHVAKSITGTDWEARGAGPANEGYMLIETGIPTLCGFGPRGGNAHAPDEWVSVESIPETIAMFAGTILEFFG